MVAGSGSETKNAKATKTAQSQHNQHENDWQEYDDPNLGLISQKISRRKKHHFDALSASWAGQNPKEWQRPYWLGSSLCLILFAFWMLDSLKDPIFGNLVNGNLDRHQPIAKLVSVATTLSLVIFLEFLSSARKEWEQQQEENHHRSNEGVLGAGGDWSTMRFQDDEEAPTVQNSNAESLSLVYILVSYVVGFVSTAQILKYHPSYSDTKNEKRSECDGEENDCGLTSWHFVGYFFYAMIESFGSLAVASFWSFTNTTLSLEDAERYYGPIIAIAQLGAIGGSTMVTTNYPDTTLIYLACLVIILHLVVMNLYTQRFRPTNIQAIVASDEDMSQIVDPCVASSQNQRESLKTLISASTNDVGETSALWSGVHLILRHNYVLLLLGVSCLYEVSLTCLDYQMKLIGYNRFENNADTEGLSFVDFMGHYGQLVNGTSLFLSLIAFPFFIRRLGLQYTLRIFPSLLVLATVVAFGALPGNLAVLFISMSILKAMTYSIHDPSTELLYLPTSNDIKFKAKFWIDAVGARVAKAIGSTLNTFAGSVDRSVSVGSMPSLLTAILLWVACYCAGRDFDRLVESGTIVGLDDSPTRRESGTDSGIYMADGDNEAEQFDDANDDTEHEANFVSSQERSTETIELNDLNSAMNFQECRRVSV